MSNENNSDSAENSSAFVQSIEFCSEEKKCEENRGIEVGDAPKEVAQDLTNGKTLQTRVANDANFIEQNLVEENTTSICNFIAKSDIILPNYKEMRLGLDEQVHTNVNITSNGAKTQENPTISDVQQILLEVIDNVTEKYIENGCKFSGELSVDLNQNREEMDDTPYDMQGDVGGQRHGLKRTHEQAALGTSSLSTADDKSYVMALVQEELSAVEKQIDNKERAKLVDYGSDSSDDSSTEEESSESSSSDSESTISSSESSVDERIILDKHDDKPVTGPPKTKDEILLNDLPPEPLVNTILADDVNLVGIGVILSIVECVVVIRALPKTPAVDADTLLFLENRKCIGKVFETFGPVQNPFYSVRFNSEDDISNADMKPNMVIYFAPEDLDMTKLIFTSQIEKNKGSDASWKHDQEPPVELIEYSDDEEEAQVKAKRKKERKAGRQGNQEQDTQSQDTTSKPNFCRKTWQGRGRGRAIQQTHPRLPPHGVTQPPPINLSAFPAQPGQFMHPPFIPPVNPGHYMPPPPLLFNIPPPPLPPHLSTCTVHHGQGAPPPVQHGHHAYPARHPGPGILPPPSNPPDFRNIAPPTAPLGPGVCPPRVTSSRGGPPQHAVPQGPPPWPLTFPPSRQ